MAKPDPWLKGSTAVWNAGAYQLFQAGVLLAWLQEDLRQALHGEGRLRIKAIQKLQQPVQCSAASSSTTA